MATLTRLSSGSLKALPAAAQGSREGIRGGERFAGSGRASLARYAALPRAGGNLRELRKLPVSRPNERAKRILQRFATLEG
jgi:hypothetical protein